MTEDQQVVATSRLFVTVVKGGYCIGCGACAAVSKTETTMVWDDFGCYQAEQRAEIAASKVLDVCPFSDRAMSEDEIARHLFLGAPHHSDKLGFYQQIFAGHVAEENYREQGSSGGAVSWVLTQLLRENQVDGVAHVKPHVRDASDQSLFRYGISRTEAEVRAGAKSRYYPVEMSGVLAQIRDTPGRYAVVGLPCFIKAIRLLAAQEPIIAERIRFTVAIFCGHLKSARFADLLAWQLGTPPGQIQSIDFRKKIAGRQADDYGVEVTDLTTGQLATRTQPMATLAGADWGVGYFKYHACEFCDDVVGETADISIGDAWLPESVMDHRGTNVVIVRHPELLRIVQSGVSEQRLDMKPLSAEKAIASQAAGFRHRREGLAYRLLLMDRQGKWRPPKRVKPHAQHLKLHQKRRFKLRMELARVSHMAFRRAVLAQDLQVFYDCMAPLLKRYRATDNSLLGKVVRLVRSYIRRICGVK